MRKLLALISILTLALTFLMPAPVLAAQPVDFNADATISCITPGASTQLGHSNQWQVLNRQIVGSVNGSITGDFTLTYEGVFNLDTTQAGYFDGTLASSGAYQMNVVGTSQPLELVWVDTFGTYLPKLNITGQWLFSDGNKGHGKFSGWVIFIPVDKHVGPIIASSLNITGKWQP